MPLPPTASPDVGPADASDPTLLLIGASRGLGLGLAEEFARRCWRVVGTVRPGPPTALHDLAERLAGRIAVETLDITRPDQIAALRDRLADRRFDMLFINAGTTNPQQELAGEIASAEYARVMDTNALGPLRVIESLRHLVRDEGLIGVMSSGQGSLTHNTNGLREVYRSSKAALNQLMRSHAARHADTPRPLVLLAPGWIRTELGGPDAPYTVEDSTPQLVDVLLRQRERPGLAYLDRFGETVPW